MIVKKLFGYTAANEKVDSFTLSNSQGTKVEIITYGATVNSIVTLDRNGAPGEITVGFDSIEGHEKYSANQGMTIGRYANRISGKFTLDGNTFELSKNEKGITCLHSDGEASHKIWKAIIIDDTSLEMTLKSEDGTSGFPGNIDFKVTFTLFEDNSLRISYFAVSDKKTVINMTNHTYFNLKGSGDVLGHELFLNASHFTPTDENSIPTGEIRPVANTPFDFTSSKPIGRDINASDTQLKMCLGFDHNFCLDEGDCPAASVYEPESGRTLEVYTDLPGLQLYTGNFLDGTVAGKGGILLEKHMGFCLETQFYPDTPNIAAFPQCTYDKDEPFESETVFKFGVKK